MATATTRHALETLDEALVRLAPYGPDLANGMTSHAPMAVEALCALGRPDAVFPFLERYRSLLLPRPAAKEPIPRAGWRGALAREDRFGDWSAFFEEELREASWRDVLERWALRLAPGICAAATHGVIRVGHAVRSLAARETPARLRELADALASWAYAYQELPTRRGVTRAAASAREAIARVAVVPPEERRFTGTIVGSLAALSGFPAFAPAIDLLDVSGSPERVAADLAETFARVALGSAQDALGAIVFVHGVTSVSALEHLLPHLSDATARTALAYAWQAGAGLYAAFGREVAGGEVEPPRADADALVDAAVAHGDEHAIKLAEACLGSPARRASPVFRAAVDRALALIPRP
jgi:hypothetical protein